MKTIHASLIIFFSFGVLQIEGAEKTKKHLTWQKIVTTAQVNHPAIRALNLKRKELMGGEVRASAIPNPEADSKILYNFDQSHIAGEVTITQKLELGGKRRARISEARSETRRYLLLKRIKEQRITGETILLLNRLGQIKEELITLTETRRTMEVLMARYRRFPRLTPEIQVSRSVYHLVLQDTVRNQTLLTVERDRITGRLSRWTGIAAKDISNVSLPDYTVLPDPGTGLNSKSPRIALLDEGITGAKASMDTASALAFPDLALGPSFSGSGYGSTREIAAGFSISIPLPVFNRNKGGRKIADSRYRQAQTVKQIETARLMSLRADMLKQYRSLAAVIKKNGRKDHARDHHRLHINMNRGKVSPSLIIEFHRQNIESLTSSHTIQHKALILLMTIRGLDGTINKELIHESQ